MSKPQTIDEILIALWQGAMGMAGIYTPSGSKLDVMSVPQTKQAIESFIRERERADGFLVAPGVVVDE